MVLYQPSGWVPLKPGPSPSTSGPQRPFVHLWINHWLIRRRDCTVTQSWKESTLLVDQLTTVGLSSTGPMMPSSVANRKLPSSFVKTHMIFWLKLRKPFLLGQLAYYSTHTSVASGPHYGMPMPAHPSSVSTVITRVPIWSVPFWKESSSTFTWQPLL